MATVEIVNIFVPIKSLLIPWQRCHPKLTIGRDKYPDCSLLPVSNLLPVWPTYCWSNTDESRGKLGLGGPSSWYRAEQGKLETGPEDSRPTSDSSI